MKYIVGIQKKVVIKTSLLKDKIYERIIKVKLLEDKGYPCVAPDITEVPYYRGEHPSDADIYSCTGDPTFHWMMVITSDEGGMAGACGTDILTSSDSYLRRDYGTDTTLRPSLNNKGWVMTRLGTSIMVPSTCNIGCRSNRKQAGVLAAVYQRRLLGREGLRVTPNLYYKLVEKDLIPVYISSAPHTYGMHKCDNLPYHLDLSDNCPVLPMLDGVQSVRVGEQSASEEERHEKIVKTFSQLIDSC